VVELESAHTALLAMQRRRLQVEVAFVAAHAPDVWEWPVVGEVHLRRRPRGGGGCLGKSNVRYL
jgi:hypothetical protein